MPGFKQPEGDLLELSYNENYAIVEWEGPGRILFSFAQKGDKPALLCHFSSDSDGLRHIKTAIDDFAHYVRETMPWCKMLLATIDRPSIKRLVEKCSFELVISNGSSCAYARSLWDS